MKKLILCMSILACVPAFATGIGNTATTNNNQTYNQPSATGNGYGGAGGAGGQGGQGGSGGAGGSASAGAYAGAAAINANDLSNKNSNTINTSNKNTNTNNNANVQGQQQGQSQGQGQSQSSNSDSSVKNSGNSSSSSGVKNSGNSASSSNSGGNSQSNAGNNASTNVSVGGDTYEAARIPVATAYAPSIAPTAPCMGSTSGGVQGMSFGVSVGSTWTDTNCQLLEQVRAVATTIGDKETAAEMMNAVPAYAEAKARIEARKNGTKSTATSISDAANAPAKVATAKPEYTDPIVRARLGLPPLK